MVHSYPIIQNIDDVVVKQFDLTIEAIVSIRRCKTLISQGNQQINKAFILLQYLSQKHNQRSME